MRRMTTGTVLLAGIALGLPGVGAVEAQVGVVARAQACRSGLETGDLGITGLDCRGDCTLTMDQEGREVSWSFSVEPRIIGVTARGPAEGILRAGDELVAIDGLLITTAAGGRRYAAVAPGEEVRIRFRREGRTEDATIRAGSRCVTHAPPPPPHAAPAGVARLAPPPPRPDEAPAAATVAVAPRVRVARGVATTDSVRGVVAPARGVAGVVSTTTAALVSPRAHLGFGFRCSDCGTVSDEKEETDIWFFSGPIEVTAVREGGVAEEAGIQIGDLIKAINGHPLESEEGGRAFSTLEEGEPVRLTVVKRNGREVEVRVVPEEEDRLVSAAAAPAPPIPTGRAPAAVTAPRGALVSPAPRTGVVVSAGVAPPPPDAPLRYSGTLEGVEVEVRGAPVTVSEERGARIILIQSQGLWIRIRVPPGRDAPIPEKR